LYQLHSAEVDEFGDHGDDVFVFGAEIGLLDGPALLEATIKHFRLVLKVTRTVQEAE